MDIQPDGVNLVRPSEINPGKLLRLYAHQPDWMAATMIKLPRPEIPESVPIDAAASSLGDLDIFPHEILDLIAVNMDIQSLLRFKLVSKKAKLVVDSCKEFRLFLKHAATTAAALFKTRLAAQHSVLRLCETLRDGRCICSGEFGPFLFLPTCERVCWLCTQLNPAFWVVPVYEAHEAFGFQRHELQLLPQIYSVPVGTSMLADDALRLKTVSVRQAKALSVKLNGLEKAKEIWDHAVDDPKLSENRAAFVDHLQRTDLGPPYNKASSVGTWDRLMTRDRYSNMASIAFPWLRPDGKVEGGLWCRGCEWLTQMQTQRGNNPDEADPLGGFEPSGYFGDRDRLARTKEEFLEHIKDCPGAIQTLSTFDAEDWEAWGDVDFQDPS